MDSHSFQFQPYHAMIYVEGEGIACALPQYVRSLEAHIMRRIQHPYKRHGKKEGIG
jgi:hypothetical protein